MDRDILLLCYYSSGKVPPNCWLGLSRDIAHRNMFLRPCGNVIHFEFPAFEDHSYNSICYGKGIKSLIKHEGDNEKYIIFRTKDPDTGCNNIIGYYKLGKAYYQETNLFNYYGFVWGILAKPAHLLRKGEIESDYKGESYVCSWRNTEWNIKLNKWVDLIDKHENVSDYYQKETNQLIDIFKNEDQVLLWKKACGSCVNRSLCPVHRYFNYVKQRGCSDMFKVIHDVYTSNLYSRNVLENNSNCPKKFINVNNKG